MQDEKSSEGEWWGWLHINGIVLKATELHTRKWLKMVNFMLCVFYHNF